jgi:hypothetical protein
LPSSNTMAPSRFDNGTVGTNYSSIHSADAFVNTYQVHPTGLGA